MDVLTHRREYSSIIAGALIFALLVGGLPSLSGVIIADLAGAPAFTLDFCHAAPGANHGAGFSPVPLSRMLCEVEAPLPTGKAYEQQTLMLIRASDAPDPPRPK